MVERDGLASPTTKEVPMMARQWTTTQWQTMAMAHYLGETAPAAG